MDWRRRDRERESEKGGLMSSANPPNRSTRRENTQHLTTQIAPWETADKLSRKPSEHICPKSKPY